MTKIAGLLICWGLLLAPCAMAQTQSLAPTYWNQRLFFIPYQVKPDQVKQRGKLLNPIAKVQLLSSRTGANDWSMLEEAEPNVQGFSYHAPEDGEYWFALRHLDRRGQPWPNDKVQPQMRIVVDTAQPELALEGSLDTNGQIVVRYEALDANLQAESLLVEVRGVGNQWTPLRLARPDIAQPNRLVGRVRWQPPVGAESIAVRAAITDRAGLRGQADTQISVRGTQSLFEGPALNSPTSAKTISTLKPKESRLPSQDWPLNNRLPLPETTLQQAPPQRNPYTVADRGLPSRTKAKLASDAPTDPSNATQTLRITPLGPNNAPPLADSTPWPAPSVKTKTSPSDWAPAHTSSDQASRVVNSRTFDIEYDLQSVGPWGIAKVELWGTHDNGRTWQSYGVDPDNRSPIRVTVPGAGIFGFRILVDGANTAGAVPPQPGDEPELTVSVDLQPPTAELLATELGQGNQAGHLQVRWTATDTNLEPRPIALFYSSYPNGPWSTIASGLENTGSYTWRIGRHVPGRFYLRLEARDIAGNLATFQTPSPIALARPQPTGRLRNVRPITNGSRL